MGMTSLRTLPTDIQRIAVPTGIPIGDLNSYLIMGRVPTLVDIGPKTPGGYEALVKGLAEHGLAPSDIQQLVITHAHPDHYGEARRFREESGAKVCTYVSNKVMLEDQEAEWARRARYFSKMATYCGAPKDMVGQVERRYQILAATADSVQVDITVREGDTLDLGDASWEVLYTPGHSMGAIGLYQRETRRLLGGDTLLGSITANPVVEPPLEEDAERTKSLVVYLETLSQLDRLEFDIIYPGHGEMFNGHHERIKQIYAFHEARKETMYNSIVEGCDTVYVIAHQFFPNVSTFEFPLAMFEVLGHLDILENEGRIGYIVDANGAARIQLA